MCTAFYSDKFNSKFNIGVLLNNYLLIAVLCSMHYTYMTSYFKCVF